MTYTADWRDNVLSRLGVIGETTAFQADDECANSEPNEGQGLLKRLIMLFSCLCHGTSLKP